MRTSLARFPTLFVPNEANEMDLQAVRARYADRNGLGLFLSARDVYGAGDELDEILDWRTRAEMRERCQRISATDGAAEIARFIEELAYAIGPARPRGGDGGRPQDDDRPDVPVGKPAAPRAP